MGIIGFMFGYGNGFNSNLYNNRLYFGFWLFFGSCFRYSKKFYLGNIMIKKILNFLDYVLFAGFMFYVFFGLKPTIDWLLINYK